MVAVRKVGRGDYDGIGQFQQRIDIGDRGTAVGVGEGLGGTGIDIQYTHQFGRFEGVQRARAWARATPPAPIIPTFNMATAPS